MHYRLRPDQVEDRFGPYELAELAVAESEAPWGESAENLRMLYIAHTIRAVNAGGQDGFDAANGAANRILAQLMGWRDANGSK